MNWIQKSLQGVRTLAISCTQWGDTGKGKLVDMYASEWADIIARGTGGANAGHTIVAGGRKFVCHLLPSGILHPGKLNVIGSGVAVEPEAVVKELSELDRSGVPYGDLAISMRAHLVLPQHIVLDRVSEKALGGGKIGTTGRGMRPVYEDHVARVGLVMNDLLNPDVFLRKLRRNLEGKVRLLRTYDPELVREVMFQEILLEGRFYSNQVHIFDVDQIVDTYLEYARRLERRIRNTDAILQGAVGRKNILLEGAQGNMLSIDYGTYPYVTSSDCSVRGMTKGVGLREADVDLSLGIVKAPYMTRVGGGPFPTELGGAASASHCDTATRDSEREVGASLNDRDDFRRGIAIRQRGDEYGATTGRPRRTGWLDLPVLRRSKSLSGPNVVLTKLDVADGMDTVKICTHYVYEGPAYRLGEYTLSRGAAIYVAVADPEVLRYCVPKYAVLPGWRGPIRNARESEDLPAELRTMIRYIEEEAGVNVTIASVGPDREETVLVNPAV